MENECYKRSMMWSEKIDEELAKSLYRYIRFDVKISIALVSVSKDLKSLENYIRASDITVMLDKNHHIVFYYYTNIDEGHYAIKNLYMRLEQKKLNPQIVCTDIKAGDKYPQRLFQRLCAMSCNLEKKDKKYLAASKIEEGMNIFDVDLDDL